MNVKYLLSAVESMANSALHEYVVPGLSSWLVGGKGHGNVRLLSSERDTRECVTPHSHRFDFTCIVLAGWVENILFEQCTPDADGANEWAPAIMVPSIKGKGLGDYMVQRRDETVFYREHAMRYTEGESYSMQAAEIHSIQFSKGARVLFFEGPEVADNSVILEPVSHGKRVRTFQVQSWMFQPE